jgi:hypothetical protein
MDTYPVFLKRKEKGMEKMRVLDEVPRLKVSFMLLQASRPFRQLCCELY